MHQLLIENVLLALRTITPHTTYFKQHHMHCACARGLWLVKVANINYTSKSARVSVLYLRMLMISLRQFLFIVK